MAFSNTALRTTRDINSMEQIGDGKWLRFGWGYICPGAETLARTHDFGAHYRVPVRFVQTEGPNGYEHYFVVLAADVDGDEGFAGDFLHEASNVGLMAPAFDCVPG